MYVEPICNRLVKASRLQIGSTRVDHLNVRAGFLALIFTAALPVQSQQNAPPPSSPPYSNLAKSWFEPAEPMHIVGPINFVGTKGLGVYLIATPAGHIMLGGAMPPSTALVEASIRKLGYKPEDIKILLTNHAHIDHVGTLADFKKLTGATLAVMDRDVDLLASGGKIDYLFSKAPMFYFPPVKADRVLKDGDIVELGGVKLKALLTAGHTRGSTTFVTTVEEGGRSYTVVFPDGAGVNLGTKFVNNPSYPGILDDYRATIRTLESLKPDIYLSYHTEDYDLPSKRARAATEGVAAFVDPEGYKQNVARKKDRIEQLVAQETAAKKTSP